MAAHPPRMLTTGRSLAKMTSIFALQPAVIQRLAWSTLSARAASTVAKAIPRHGACPRTADSQCLSMHATSSPLLRHHFRTPKPFAIINQTRGLSGVGSSSQNLLAHMEQTANNNPSSATAQNAFYSALLRADMPAIVAERYQSGRFATNSATEAAYNKALERLVKTDGTVGSSFGIGLQNRPGFSNYQLQSVGSAVGAQALGVSSAGPKAGSTGTGEKVNPLYIVVEESRGSKVLKWLKFFFYGAVALWVSLVLVTVLVEATGTMRRTTSSTPNETTAKDHVIRFNDVKGCDEAKDELQELVEFLKNPARFSSLGGKPPKGVLLTGPPGTGKTLLARAVAGEAGVPFFVAAGSEFDEMYVGVGAKRVRELFKKARTKSPAIIFIDELDAIGSRRNDRDHAYAKQSLNQLLTELDGFTKDTGIVIIGATNLPKVLDPALTRPGRFDRMINVPLPDVRGRAAILKHYMDKVKISPEADELVIARGTTGFSGADLEGLVNQAAVRAARAKSAMITLADLDWAKDKIMMGPERRSAYIQEKDKLCTAYHEAGHALVAHYSDAHDQLHKLTIMPRGQALGLTHFLPALDEVSATKQQLLSRIDSALGGKVAEEMIYGKDRVTTGASSDLVNATRIAEHMVYECGMSEALGDMTWSKDYWQLSPETRSNIETEIRKLLSEARIRSERILHTHRDELENVARALIAHETLTRDEMLQIIGKGDAVKTTGTPSTPSQPKPPSAGPGIRLPGLHISPPALGTVNPRPEPANGAQTSPSAAAPPSMSPKRKSGQATSKENREAVK